MKQTKIMLLLAVLFSTYIFATCTKEEVIKLIDNGFSKTEINSICDMQVKSKWITPTDSTCRNYRGKVYSHGCKANWSDAKSICRASGGRLSSIEELSNVVSECGGTIGTWKENRNNSSYQKCYKSKGFISGFYWSSTTIAVVGWEDMAWSVNFDTGNGRYGYKPHRFFIRCVRDGQ